MKISVYIPLYNGGDWCRCVPLLDGVEYIASDNGSTDGSAEILEARGVTVIRQPVNLGRIGNWRFCVEHFHASDAEWMKWLFTGDYLANNAVSVIESAAGSFPEARLIASEFDIIENGVRRRQSTQEETRLYSSIEAIQRTSEKGNWFGSPIGCAIHKEAVARGYDFGEMPYAADFRFCLSIAEHSPILYLKENMGEFRADVRKFYTAHGKSQSPLIQDAWVRQWATEKFLELSGDRLEYERLLLILEQETALAIFGQAMRSETAETLLNQIRLRPLLSVLFMKIRRLLFRNH